MPGVQEQVEQVIRETSRRGWRQTAALLPTLRQYGHTLLYEAPAPLHYTQQQHVNSQQLPNPTTELRIPRKKQPPAIR